MYLRTNSVEIRSSTAVNMDRDAAYTLGYPEKQMNWQAIENCKSAWSIKSRQSQFFAYIMRELKLQNLKTTEKLEENREGNRKHLDHVIHDMKSQITNSNEEQHCRALWALVFWFRKHGLRSEQCTGFVLLLSRLKLGTQSACSGNCSRKKWSSSFNLEYPLPTFNYLYPTASACCRFVKG